MELISNKDLYYVMRDVLIGLDSKVMKHGERTAYIFHKMLQCSRTQKYSEAEMAEYVLLAAFHDLGAYKTDYQQDQLRYESRDSMPHAVFGYLMLQYLTPFKDKSKIVLYHHMDYNRLKELDVKYGELSAHINVAERMDLYSNIMGSKFDYRMFHRQLGVKYAPRSLEYLYQARLKYGIFNHINSENYISDLDELFSHLTYNEKEKQQFLTALFHCVSEKLDYTMSTMDVCIAVSEQLANYMNLSEDEKQELCYATLFKASTISEDILNGRVHGGCLDIISGRRNGVQNDILNLSVKIASLSGENGELNKEEVLRVVSEETESGNLNGIISEQFVKNYDKISLEINEKLQSTSSLHRKMKEGYDFTLKQIMKQAGL